MRSPNLTTRQQIMALLREQLHSARDLAAVLSIPEREVENHLTHVMRSLGRNSQLRFMMEHAFCHRCGFLFRERTRLTRPSRCPRCRSEDIASPRFGVEGRTSKDVKVS